MRNCYLSSLDANEVEELVSDSFGALVGSDLDVAEVDVLSPLLVEPVQTVADCLEGQLVVAWVRAWVPVILGSY